MTTGQAPSLQRKQALKAFYPPVATYMDATVICKQAGEISLILSASSY